MSSPRGLQTPDGAWPSLERRQRLPELMDDPALPAAEHLEALGGLRRIQLLSGTASQLWGSLRAWAPNPGAPLRLLDVATGGGDLPLALAARARRAGLLLRVAGCDLSARALERARRRAAELGVAADFFVWDALSERLPERWDVVTCSLFLHHLEDAQVVGLLERLARAARLLLVHDLERRRAGHLLAWWVPRLLTRSRVVHHDGPRSVLAAYSASELRQLAARAGLETARVRRRWPWRLELSWEAA